jgi:thioredoxin-dependent peroxiredoxin
MVAIALHKPIPDFSLPATSGQSIRLADLRGKYIILYFYPKDCTSGCTLEAQMFRDYYPQFHKLNTLVFGISRDTLKLHEKFKADQKLPFPLLSDENEKICTLFEVIKEKNMYGRKVRGIERSTFLIDPQGMLIQEWRKVKIEGHIKELLTAIKSYRKTS